MQQYANLRMGITVLLCGAIYALAIAQRWSFIGMVLGFALGVLAIWLGAVLWHRYRIVWFREFLGAIKQLRSDQGATVIAELEARRAVGDRSIPVTLTLSAAYSYTGRGMEAEALADEGIEGVVAANLCARRDLSARMQCEFVRIARYDALVAQGRFAEAAHGLRPGASSALQPNFMIAIIAWAFFLADDSYNASIVLREVRTPGGFRKQADALPPKYHLMVLYMRFVLLGDNTLSAMRKFTKYLAEWEDSAARNAGAPYGTRLRAILDALRPLLQRGGNGIIG